MRFMLTKLAGEVEYTGGIRNTSRIMKIARTGMIALCALYVDPAL